MTKDQEKKMVQYLACIRMQTLEIRLCSESTIVAKNWQKKTKQNTETHHH